MPLFYSENKFLNAVWRRDYSTVSKYLAHKEKSRWLAARGARNETALHYAARRQDETLIKMLVEAGCPLDALNRDGRTALSLAQEANYPYQRAPLVRALLKAGADPGLPRDGLYNPLYYAMSQGDQAAAGELLQAKADPSQNAVLRAALWDKSKLGFAEMLLKAGARLDSAGDNPGHGAALHGSVTLLQMLKDAGLDLAETDGEGKSALHVAAANGHLKAVEFLLSEGLDASLRDGAGQTPLHKAAQGGHAAIVEKLLAAGERADVEDNQKMTALSWARQKDSVPVVRMLEEAEKSLLAQGANALTATVNVVPASEEETWVRMGDHQVARVGVYPALGRRLTEIFNFESRERMVISENLKTGAENVTPPASFDALNEAALRKALDAFRALGGTAADSAVLEKPAARKPLSAPGPAPGSAAA